MPLYEYECEACSQRFELIQKFSDPPPDACARCGAGPVRRLLSSPAIQFKGSGWYITDYSQKGKSESAGDGKPKAAEGGDKAAGEKADAAAAAKTDTKAKTDSGPSSSAPAGKT